MKYKFQNGQRDKNPQNPNLFFYKKYLASTKYICILRDINRFKCNEIQTSTKD